MIDPVNIKHLDTAFISSALIVTFGGLYAYLFARSKISGKRWLIWPAYFSYACLTVSVIYLCAVANFINYSVWLLLTILMLTGYLIFPHVIWKLCLNTYTRPQVTQNSLTNNRIDETLTERRPS